MDVNQYMVIGIGGTASSILVSLTNTKHDSQIKFYAIDSDCQYLHFLNLPQENKICIEECRREGFVEISNIMKSVQLVKNNIKDRLNGRYCGAIVLAAFGGGTATAVTPVVAEILNELSIPAIYILSSPFRFEGMGRMRRASDGLFELKKHSSLNIVFDNEAIVQNNLEGLNVFDGFKKSDEIFTFLFNSVIELYTKENTLNRENLSASLMNTEQHMYLHNELSDIK